MNINKLKGKVVERGWNIEKLADSIGTERSTLYRKLQRPDSKITIGEAAKMKDKLGLTNEEACAIFFSTEVAYGATNVEGGNG